MIDIQANKLTYINNIEYNKNIDLFDNIVEQVNDQIKLDNLEGSNNIHILFIDYFIRFPERYEHYLNNSLGFSLTLRFNNHFIIIIIYKIVLC